MTTAMWLYAYPVARVQVESMRWCTFVSARVIRLGVVWHWLAILLHDRPST